MRIHHEIQQHEDSKCLAKSSFSEIMEPKFEMCLRNNGRRGVRDSKYKPIFSRFSATKSVSSTWGKKQGQDIFFSCLYICFKMMEIIKEKLTI